MMASAYLLVAHGSQDPHYQVAVTSLVQQVSNHFQTTFQTTHQPTNQPTNRATNQPTLVGSACLELTPTPLHEQILAFATLAGQAGIGQINLLPLFLLPGVHVTQDIPHQVDLARQGLQAQPSATQLGTIVPPSAIKLNLLPHLGECPQLVQVLASPASLSVPGSQAIGKILLSHGSRRPGSNQPVERLAQELGAIAAYWSVHPDLETQLHVLVQQGCSKIEVLPYVLFAGSLTTTITHRIEQLRQQFPHLEIALAPPIAAHPQLTLLLSDWLLAVSFEL